jgi:heat shock protein HslJ
MRTTAAMLRAGLVSLVALSTLCGVSNLILSLVLEQPTAEARPPAARGTGVYQVRPAGPELVGTMWTWIESKDSNDNTLTANSPDYTITFLPDGKLNIQADCNRASGSYKVSGSQLQIEVGAMTLAECPPGSLSDLFVHDLGKVVSYLYDGGDLVLTLKMDSGIMKFSSESQATRQPLN